MKSRKNATLSDQNPALRQFTEEDIKTFTQDQYNALTPQEQERFVDTLNALRHQDREQQLKKFRTELGGLRTEKEYHGLLRDIAVAKVEHRQALYQLAQMEGRVPTTAPDQAPVDEPALAED
jgi:hypothetical protein